MSAQTTWMLDPAILAWWTRAIRHASHWSQEALAASSGLTVRTIQRVEAGRLSDVTTRRALARGLGYSNPEIFFDPEFAKTVTGFFRQIEQIGKEALERRFPDRLRLRATPVLNGAELSRLAEIANAYNYCCDDDVSEEAKECAAALFDYLNDYGEAHELYSHVDKLAVHRELDSFLKDLEKFGVTVDSALQSTAISSENWPNQTPLPIDILCLVVHPKGRIIEEFWVPKKIRPGF
jgi:transcriptional regulator with XRE-family HTH domain